MHNAPTYLTSELSEQCGLTGMGGRQSVGPAEERRCLHVELGEGGTQTVPQVLGHSLRGGEAKGKGEGGGGGGGGGGSTCVHKVL